MAFTEIQKSKRRNLILQDLSGLFSNPYAHIDLARLYPFTRIAIATA
ncbi:MAG: hypothetical protein V7K14_15355 [Nostoc sp.]